MIDQLHDYQIAMKDFIKTHPFCGCFVPMGMGKTISTLAALLEIRPQGHILIIAPKTIAKSTWLDELEKWSIPANTLSLIVNDNGKKLSKKKRIERYESLLDGSAPPSICFINRDLVTDLQRYMDNRWPFPTVVIDESQSFKSQKSERFKALLKARPYISRMVLLSGTPTPNGMDDLWPQIKLLDLGFRLGKFMSHYHATYFSPTLMVDNHPVKWELRPGAKEIIYQKVGDIVMSMENTHIKLPGITINDVVVTMDENEAACYDDFMHDQVIELSDPDEPITAANAAVLTNKLTQMASGTLYKMDKETDNDYELIHDKKLDMLEYIINNTPSPVLVAYNFRCDIKRILERIPQAIVFDGSRQMQKDWNDKKIPVMLLQPKSAGHGINIQYGGHTLVWFTMPWSLEEYMQTNARIYRQGQTEPVMIHRIITRGTVDRKIAKVLEQKDAQEKSFLDAIQLYVNEYQKRG